jgi:hypothetical protein
MTPIADRTWLSVIKMAGLPEGGIPAFFLCEGIQCLSINSVSPFPKGAQTHFLFMDKSLFLGNSFERRELKHPRVTILTFL